MTTSYQCDLCRRVYETAAEAKACEARGVDASIVRVGDIVFVYHCFGWYDGEASWVSNPDVFLKRNGAKCPKGSSNCFGSCCNFRFYYVVTAIDFEGHRTRYHLVTLAMTGKNGHRGGYTFNAGHFVPEKVKNPPAVVVETAKKLIGQKRENLL